MLTLSVARNLGAIRSKIQTAKAMMATGEPALVELIAATIRRRGPVTFAWFMEQALYHPEFGYYSSGRCAIGRHGDYFTNVSVGPLFGRMLAAQFAEMWDVLGRPGDFVIVEQGAHHGDFARDVLEAAQAKSPEFFAALRYRIIEPFPVLRQRQAETLSGFAGKAAWGKSLADLEPFSGVHFSNELIDAMPVHLLKRTQGKWEEKLVATSGDGFIFMSAPIADETLRRHVEHLPTSLPDDYLIEANLAASDWIRQVSEKLVRGYFLGVDYGYASEKRYAPERSGGSLQCYAQHRVLDSPLFEIGHADITAHVDWTSMAERAEQHGLSVAGFADQHHFFTGLISELMREEFGPHASASTRRKLQTLLHPEFLGTSFQFLGLSKNAPAGQLSGFRFARALL
jgi:SAM-dependent MidA family methyltransferase